VDINLAKNQIAKTPFQHASTLYYILAGINSVYTIDRVGGLQVITGVLTHHPEPDLPQNLLSKKYSSN